MSIHLETLRAVVRRANACLKISLYVVRERLTHITAICFAYDLDSATKPIKPSRYQTEVLGLPAISKVKNNHILNTLAVILIALTFCDQ